MVHDPVLGRGLLYALSGCKVRPPGVVGDPGGPPLPPPFPHFSAPNPAGVSQVVWTGPPLYLGVINTGCDKVREQVRVFM